MSCHDFIVTLFIYFGSSMFLVINYYNKDFKKVNMGLKIWSHGQKVPLIHDFRLSGHQDSYHQRD